MKIAIYKMGATDSTPFSLPCEVTEWRESDSNYCRVTDAVDIEFPPRNPAEIVPAQIAILDREREDIVTKFTEALKTIDNRKAELLALTGPTS